MTREDTYHNSNFTQKIEVVPLQKVFSQKMEDSNCKNEDTISLNSNLSMNTPLKALNFKEGPPDKEITPISRKFSETSSKYIDTLTTNTI